MDPRTIHKPATPANLTDYQSVRDQFTWTAARARLAGLPGGRGLNIAHEAVDRHVLSGQGNRVALRCRGRTGRDEDITYGHLRGLTNKFANVLRGLGIGRGDRVATLLGRVPELYVAALGTLKNTSVYTPLFAAFGPEPVRERLRLGDVKVLVTTPALYRRKIAAIRDGLPQLRHVLLVGAATGDLPGGVDLRLALDAAGDDFEIPDTDPRDMALLHFTSGTTGKPKGAVHVHEAVLAHHVTAAFALDLRPDDIFWCTADPGWVTGTSYGIIAPLTHGATVVVDASEFDHRGWYQTLQDERVTVWYTAPTALRMLMPHSEVVGDYDLSALRFIASVGEPLNPEVVSWSHRVLGLPVHDNWWQTETGAIMIGNYQAMDIRPGSMGRPMPGVAVGLLERDMAGHVLVTDGHVREVTDPNVVGEIALRPGWPSMFRGYLHDDTRYGKSFMDGWYLSGDLARRDEDGYYWFVGRADDVIKSAGHLVGPFEVESALMEHPAVAEAGVIGKPDPVFGETVKAFVALRPGFHASDELRFDLIAFGRRRLGAVAPKDVAFNQNMPHTRSGKVMRRLLKARELGLPEGDISTLEGAR